MKLLWKPVILALAVILPLAGCTSAPGDKLADKIVEAETRPERVTRIFCFSTVVTDYAVRSTKLADTERTRLFTNQLMAALNAFDQDPEGLWVETNIMDVVQGIATGARGRIAGLVSAGVMPGLDKLLTYARDGARSSAMLRDVRYIIEEVRAGNQTGAWARTACRERIMQTIDLLPAPTLNGPPIIIDGDGARVVE